MAIDHVDKESRGVRDGPSCDQMVDKSAAIEVLAEHIFTHTLHSRCQHAGVHVNAAPPKGAFSYLAVKTL